MRILLVFVFLMFVGGRPALADPAFEAYVQQLAEHPQVLQMLEQRDRYRELAAGEMGLPDPTVTLGISNLPVSNPSFDREMMTSKMIGFSQAIPSHALRQARAGMHEALSEKQRLMGEYAHHRLAAMFTAMLVKREQINRQVDFANRQLKHYQELENYFKGRLEAGSGVYWRFSEVDVERSMVEQRLNDLKAEREEIEAELVRLVGEVPDVSVPEIPNTDWDGNPETLYPVRLAHEDVMTAETQKQAAEAGFKPNYGVSAAYMQRDSVMGNDLDDMFTVQASVSIPLWAEQNQKPKLRAAQAGKRSSEQAYADTVREWTRRMTALASKRDAALANVFLLEEKAKALQEMVDSVERNYEAGGSDLNTVLGARINRLNILSQLAEQRARHLMLASEFNSHFMGEVK